MNKLWPSAAAALKGVVADEMLLADGNPKLLPHCTLPLRGAGVVNRIITNLGVMDVTPDGIEVVELADGVSPGEFGQRSGVAVRFAI
jgi:3-oxoacid CoA-transferase subunit B